MFGIHIFESLEDKQMRMWNKKRKNETYEEYHVRTDPYEKPEGTFYYD